MASPRNVSRFTFHVSRFTFHVSRFTFHVSRFTFHVSRFTFHVLGGSITATAKPIRVAIIGTAARSDYLYGPLVKALPEVVELVAVWGRSEDSVRRLGESLAAPWYTNLDQLVRETAPEIGIVSVPTPPTARWG